MKAGSTDTYSLNNKDDFPKVYTKKLMKEAYAIFLANVKDYSRDDNYQSIYEMQTFRENEMK